MTADEHVAAATILVAEIRAEIEELRIYPRRGQQLDSVALTLLSKSIIVSNAVLLLLREHYFEEAFGLVRTLVEIQITVRYIANQDAEVRAQRFAHFIAKDMTQWSRLYERYYDMKLATRVDWKDVERAAEEYKSAIKWSEAPDGLKSMAGEADCYEIGNSGKPVNELFVYEILYRWMSFYVHGTISGLAEHYPKVGEPFKVYRQNSPDGLPTFDTIVMIVLTGLYAIIIRVFRALNTDVPQTLQLKLEASLALAEHKISKC